MKIYVNNKETYVYENMKVNELAQQLQLPDKGIALAVNNQMIPRTEWSNTTLKAESHVIIIKAACGG